MWLFLPKLKWIIKGTHLEGVVIKRSIMKNWRGIQVESFQQYIEVWQGRMGKWIKSSVWLYMSNGTYITKNSFQFQTTNNIVFPSKYSDKIKRDFFQTVTVPILLYGCTNLNCRKCMLDGNYTRMLHAVLNKSWNQAKLQLYGHLPSIS